MGRQRLREEVFSDVGRRRSRRRRQARGVIARKKGVGKAERRKWALRTEWWKGSELGVRFAVVLHSRCPHQTEPLTPSEENAFSEVASDLALLFVFEVEERVADGDLPDNLLVGDTVVLDEPEADCRKKG